VGAARKNVLIHPARTEISTMASAPKIQPSRQAVSRVASDMIRLWTNHKQPIRKGRNQRRTRRTQRRGTEYAELSIFKTPLRVLGASAVKYPTFVAFAPFVLISNTFIHG
jgi:hypothetical protein